MNLKLNRIDGVDLHLFDGGTAAAGAEAAAPAAGSANQGDTQAPAVEVTRPQQKSDLSKVRYGKQTEPNKEADGPAAGQQGKAPAGEAPDTLEARTKAFEELVNGEYKDVYTRKTQELINRRFGQDKRLEAENAKLREIAEMLNTKYGVTDDADFSKLRAAVEGDDELWAQAAEAAGMTTEQYRRFSKLERQNAAYEAMRNNDILAEKRRQKAEHWLQEAQALQEKFPNFDLKAELGDRNFVSALNAGVPMELVYKGKYYDQNLASATAQTRKQTEKNVSDNIRARGTRPAENGTGSQSAAFITRDDPSQWTKADRDEVVKRVMRGEKIRL